MYYMGHDPCTTGGHDPCSTGVMTQAFQKNNGTTRGRSSTYQTETGTSALGERGGRAAMAIGILKMSRSRGLRAAKANVAPGAPPGRVQALQHLLKCYAGWPTAFARTH